MNNVVKALLGIAIAAILFIAAVVILVPWKGW